MTTKNAVILGLAAVLLVGIVSGTLVYTTIYAAKAAEDLEQTKLKAAEGQNSSRYELREFRHGNTVGLALLDKEIGRVWLLTRMTDPTGRKLRDDFKEVAVEDLWQTTDELFDVFTAAPPFDSKAFTKLTTQEQVIKLLSRPKIVRDAEAEYFQRERYRQKIGAAQK